MAFVEKRIDNSVIWSNPAINITSAQFDPLWYREHATVIAEPTGRGAVCIYAHDGRRIVHRKYRRGGLVGKINRARFLGWDPKSSRPFRELELLHGMAALGLPVPTPIAGRMVTSGITYTADILTQEISAAETLLEYLKTRTLSGEKWNVLGGVIKRFHENGVDHTDLNISNIMIDDVQKFWLIDFDKCRFRGGSAWTDHNLARLHRSFEKQRAIHGLDSWTQENWRQLMDGYHR